MALFIVRHPSPKDEPDAEKLARTKAVLFAQVLRGRIPFGWSWSGYDLRRGETLWCALHASEPRSSAARALKSWNKVRAVLDIAAGAAVILPDQPEPGWVTVARAVASAKSGPGAYGFAPNRSVTGDDDFHAYIAVDVASIRLVRPGASRLPPAVRRKLAHHRYPARGIHEPDLVSAVETVLAESAPPPVQVPEKPSESQIQDWYDHNVTPYFATTKASRRRRSRAEFKFVNWAASWLTKHDAAVGYHDRIDLMTSSPTKVWFEAKATGHHLAVRQAVGQLLWYRFDYPNRVADHLCVLLGEAPAMAGVVEFVENHAGMHIAWRDGANLVGGPKTAAALAKLGVKRALSH